MPLSFLDGSLAMRARLVSFALAMILLSDCLLVPASGGAAEAGQPAAERAPWQRRLQGEDRKRVEELQKQFDALREAGKYADALAPARKIFTIRTRGQGADHWETIYAKWQVKTLERILATPLLAGARLKLADWQQAQAERLIGEGKYAEAEALLRQAVVVGHDVLGEEYPLLADGYANLADILRGQGKYGEAEFVGPPGLSHPHTIAWGGEPGCGGKLYRPS